MDFKQFNFDDVKYAMHEDKGVLLFISKYAPCKSAKIGKIAISNYYVTSNKAHNKALLVIEHLINNGYEASFFHEHNIKALCASTGGFIGKNSLYIHEKFGSYVNIQAIATNYKPNEIYKQEIKPCQNCGACIHACRTHAVTHDKLIAENCLRKHIKEMYFQDNFKQELYQIMGCEKCQLLCPHNDVGFEEGIYLNINETLQLKNFDLIKSAIGKNNAKKDNIIYQTIVYAANTKYEEAYPIICKLNEQEEFKEVCNYYFTALKELRLK